MKQRLHSITGAIVLALGITVLSAGADAANEQYFPLQSYRVGPYAAGGTGFFGGFIDYMEIDPRTAKYCSGIGSTNGGSYQIAEDCIEMERRSKAEIN